MSNLYERQSPALARFDNTLQRDLLTDPNPESGNAALGEPTNKAIGSRSIVTPTTRRDHKFSTFEALDVAQVLNGMNPADPRVLRIGAGNQTHIEGVDFEEFLEPDQRITRSLQELCACRYK